MQLRCMGICGSAAFFLPYHHVHNIFYFKPSTYAKPLDNKNYSYNNNNTKKDAHDPRGKMQTNKQNVDKKVKKKPRPLNDATAMDVQQILYAAANKRFFNGTYSIFISLYWHCKAGVY